ncbi:MAG: hypothetical protein EA360_06965 [Balneolaceae bacterium]|nr:MAG: hypothetical protein EA360_06965 [Balneolaceae bacterium]
MPKSHAFFFSAVLMLFVSLQGCAFFKASHIEETEIHYPAPDPEIERLVEDYRAGIEQSLGEQIAVVEDTLTFSKPEGSLGNMAADALRYRAALELRTFVHLGIADESHYMLDFLPGSLTREAVYEFMPYLNHLVVLELRGDQITELMQQVAALGGAPLSGARFTIDSQNRARGILVNSTVVEPNKTYLIATTNRVANTGEPFPVLLNADRRIDLDISIRSLYLDFFRGRGRLTDATDGRIRS